MKVETRGRGRRRGLGLLGIGALVMAAGGGCTRGAPLQGSQKVLLGTWTSGSGAVLTVREDGSCDYRSATDGKTVRA